MIDLSEKLPSPCIGVCRYRDKGHCIACSMTKLQKKAFKRVDGRKGRVRFLRMLIAQQALIGRYTTWARVYRRKCAKKGVEAPI